MRESSSAHVKVEIFIIGVSTKKNHNTALTSSLSIEAREMRLMPVGRGAIGQFQCFQILT